MSRLKMNTVIGLAAGLAAMSAGTGPASAFTFSTAELSYDNALISQFNLVTIGSLTQTAGGATATNTDGRVLVGGNATFVTNATVCMTNCAGDTTSRIDPGKTAYGALTVFGNLTAPATNTTTNRLGPVYVGGGGDVDVGGKLTGNVALNKPSGSGALNVVGATTASTIVNAGAIRTSQSSFGGTSGNYNYSTGANNGAGVAPTVNQTVASVFPFATNFQASARNFSTGLANLPGTKGVTPQTLTVGNGIFFTANADYVNGGKSYGVITTTVADLANETAFAGINNNGNAATFVIVTGDGANYTLPNLNSYAGSNNVIFDFVNATTLKFGGNWSGSILAPLATITQGGTIDGSVIVNSINQTQALYATNLFSGDLSGLVPEPASLALIGAGLAAAGLARRRRR